MSRFQRIVREEAWGCVFEPSSEMGKLLHKRQPRHVVAVAGAAAAAVAVAFVAAMHVPPVERYADGRSRRRTELRGRFGGIFEQQQQQQQQQRRRQTGAKSVE